MNELDLMDDPAFIRKRIEEQRDYINALPSRRLPEARFLEVAQIAFDIKKKLEERLAMITIRKTVIDVLTILHEKQDSYIDSAEYIHDACKIIRSHLNDKDLILYIGDFISALNHSTNGDFDGTLSKCIVMLRVCNSTHDYSENKN